MSDVKTEEKPKLSWEDSKTKRKEQSDLIVQLLLNRYSYLHDLSEKDSNTINTFSLNINGVDMEKHSL